MYILKNWYFEKRRDYYVVWGNVYDSLRYANGQWICTSVIQEISRENQSLILKTENTYYQAEFNTHSPVDFRVLKRALRELLWPLDEELYQEIIHKQLNSKEINYTDYSCYALMDYNEGFEKLLIHRKEEFVVASYDIHQSLFQNVIEISDPRKGYCYRYYVNGKNEIEFEYLDDKLPLFIHNTSLEELYVGSIYGTFYVPSDSISAITCENTKDRVYEENRKVSHNTTIIQINK